MIPQYLVSHTVYRLLIRWLVFNSEQFFSHIMARTSYIQWNNDDVYFVIDKYALLDPYSVRSLKQQSAGRYITAFGHIIVIPSQPVFSPTHWSCVHSREAANIIFLVFGLTQPGVNPTIYSTWVKYTNHYTTDGLIQQSTALESNTLTITPLMA
jgi:hypothetical protein